MEIVAVPTWKMEDEGVRVASRPLENSTPARMPPRWPKNEMLGNRNCHTTSSRKGK